MGADQHFKNEVKQISECIVCELSSILRNMCWVVVFLTMGCHEKHAVEDLEAAMQASWLSLSKAYF